MQNEHKKQYRVIIFSAKYADTNHIWIHAKSRTWAEPLIVVRVYIILHDGMVAVDARTSWSSISIKHTCLYVNPTSQSKSNICVSDNRSKISRRRVWDGFMSVGSWSQIRRIWYKDLHIESRRLSGNAGTGICHNLHVQECIQLRKIKIYPQMTICHKVWNNAEV